MLPFYRPNNDKFAHFHEICDPFTCSNEHNFACCHQIGAQMISNVHVFIKYVTLILHKWRQIYTFSSHMWPFHWANYDKFSYCHQIRANDDKLVCFHQTCGPSIAKLWEICMFSSNMLPFYRATNNQVPLARLGPQ